MNNSIYIRRKNKRSLDKGENSLSDGYLFNLLKNIESLVTHFHLNLLKQLKHFRQTGLSIFILKRLQKQHNTIRFT